MMCQVGERVQIMATATVLSKLAAGLALAGACAAANAAIEPITPSTLPLGMTLFSASVIGVGSFSDTVSFSLPANGGSSYSARNNPFVFMGSSFSTVFSSLTLKSNPNGIMGDGDDAVVSSISLGGPSISLNVGPTGPGNYYLVVNGSVPTGNAGGLYGGGISVSPVPEPETYGLFLAGLGLLGTIMTRRRKAA